MIAQEIYRADDITADQKVRNRFDELEKEGAGSYPICMAKTQYSFSADPTLKGAPSGFTVPIRELRLSGGAEFVVAICGDVMTMPGLPRVPAANAIDVESDGRIVGLF
jgi:formate--tetrahydrofolate ligase